MRMNLSTVGLLIISIAVLSAGIFAIPSTYADSTVNEDGVIYTLSEMGGEYYAEATAYDGSSSAVIIKNTVVCDEINYPVIMIADDAFNIVNKTSYEESEKRKNITSIIIEDNNEITLTTSMFEGLVGLQSVKIGEGITEIPTQFCYKCLSLSSVEFPSTIERIGSMAFGYCKELDNVDLGENTKVIMSSAFEGCNSLSSIVIPDSVTDIGWSAFNQCYNLSEVVLGEGLTSIEATLFGLSIITEIYIPASVVSIDLGNGGQTSTFPITMEKVTVSENNPVYYSSDGVIYLKSSGALFYYPTSKSGDLYLDFDIPSNLFSGNTAITKIVIAEGVTSIGRGAFSNCKSLRDVVLPESLTTLGNRVFYGCSDLKNINLPRNIVGIPMNTFYGCSSLENIDLSNVTSIGQFAFNDCSSLIITGLPENIDSIGAGAFSGCSNVSVSSLPSGVTQLEPFVFDEAGITDIVIGDGDSVVTLITEAGCPLFGGASLKSIVFDNVVLSEVNVKNVIDFDASVNLEKVVFGSRFTNSNFIDSVFNTLITSNPDKIVTNVVKDGVTILKIEEKAVGTVTVVDGVQYTLTSMDPMECSVTGYETGITALIIPDSVEFWGVAAAVKSVGAKAFYGCDTLVSADLGNVTSVGIKAFAWCSKLKSVDAGDSLKTISAYAFYRCVRLADINLDDSAKTLKVYGSYSFYKCGKLLSIIVPSFMTTIGTKAFTLTFADENGDPLEASIGSLKGYEYSNVDGVLVRQAGPEIGSEFMSDKLVFRVSSALPNEVEVVGYSGKITSLDLSEDVTDGEFTYSVTAIGKNAFYKCRTLTSANLGNVEVIGSKAFYGCSKLASLKADSIVTIGIKAFADCSALADLELGNSLKTVSAYAFYRCTSLTSFDAPDSLTTIGSYAFYKCSALTTVHTGSSLKTIGSKAFVLTDLSEIDFPAVLKTVKSAAFDGYELLDKDASPIDATAENLRGHSFSGDGATLRTYT